jgi:hypothetical protein
VAWKARERIITARKRLSARTGKFDLNQKVNAAVRFAMLENVHVQNNDDGDRHGHDDQKASIHQEVQKFVEKAFLRLFLWHARLLNGIHFFFLLSEFPSPIW